MSTLQKLFLETVLPRMAIAPNDRILDLGCGDGWACRAMASLTSEGMVVGIDASGDAIREARRLSTGYENILYIQADAEENPWQDNFFSHVVIVDTLGELRDADATLRHAHRVMSSGGKLWVLGTSADGLAERLPGFDYIDGHSEPVADAQLTLARKP